MASFVALIVEVLDLLVAFGFQWMNTPTQKNRSSAWSSGMTPSATESATALATPCCAGPNICTACLAFLMVTLLNMTVLGFTSRFGATTASSEVKPSLLLTRALAKAFSTALPRVRSGGRYARLHCRRRPETRPRRSCHRSTRRQPACRAERPKSCPVSTCSGPFRCCSPFGGSPPTPRGGNSLPRPAGSAGRRCLARLARGGRRTIEPYAADGHAGLRRPP